MGPPKLQYCKEIHTKVIQNGTKRGQKETNIGNESFWDSKKCKTARKEAKRWLKKDLLLERPGFVIDFRADVRDVVHAQRIFEALLHKSPFGAKI